MKHHTFSRLLSGFLASLAAVLPAHGEDKPLSPEERALKTAIGKLDSQLPLSSADHTALKKAAAARKLEQLRVCGDPGNMPLSDINRAGYGNKIIELVAKEMGTEVHYFWRPYLERGITRQTFEVNECDVLLDMPVGFERILTTTPLYKTTYVLAYRNDRGIEIANLDDPKLHDLKIGVFQTSGLRTALNKRGVITNVSLHVLSHNADLKPENQPYQQVRQVLDGKLDVAGIWGPFAGWLKAQGEPLTVLPVNMWEDEIPQEFEIAIGLRNIDWILKYKFDLALEARKGEIEKTLRDFGVPLVQCSKCVVQGDLPAHGIYTVPLQQAANPATGQPLAVAPDQLVTQERVESWLSDGADIDSELANAVLAADAPRIKFLVSKGADLNKRDSQGYTALQSAARHRKTKLLEELITLKADVNATDQDGYAALHHAILRDHPDSVRVLMQNGADSSLRTASGFTPLALAILENHYKAAVALIETGAPVDTPVGEAKLTPLMLAAGSEGNKLHLGAGKHRVEKWNPKDPGVLEITRALLDKGANVNAVSETGVTALILAASHNNAPIVGMLAQAGADPLVKTKDGKTAADLAKQNGNEAVVSLLRLLEQAGNN
ncbi:MAG: quinoprotein dehydrogenase-associated putative ABC transporter substrate-binding protein [Hyphomicrobiaceae bacterium]|nr:quinoprotein dehydrogenase-associated putative ABC transporter substrate-binding protein [Hyphomicrobiaceae bacterium]